MIGVQYAHLYGGCFRSNEYTIDDYKDSKNLNNYAHGHNKDVRFKSYNFFKR